MLCAVICCRTEDSVMFRKEGKFPPKNSGVRVSRGVWGQQHGISPPLVAFEQTMGRGVGGGGTARLVGMAKW